MYIGIQDKKYVTPNTQANIKNEKADMLVNVKANAKADANKDAKADTNDDAKAM